MSTTDSSPDEEPPSSRHIGPHEPASDSDAAGGGPGTRLLSLITVAAVDRTMLRPAVARGAALVLSVALLVSVVAPVFVGPAAALVQGEPDVSLTVTDNSVSAGETTTLEVNVVNRAELEQGSSVGNVEAERRVTTARGLTLSPESNGPVTVETDVAAVGSVSDGAAVPAEIDLTVAEDADPGTYRVPVEIEYRQTTQISEQDTRTTNEETVTERRTVRVVVDEDARFEVVGVESRSPGESGTFALEVENNGTATANDAVVELSSLTGDVQFGAGGSGGGQSQQAQGGQSQGQQGARTFVGQWEPGERRTLLFQGTVDEDTPVTELPASLSVDYVDDAGVEFASESTVGITPEGDQAFTFESSDSNLRVGQEGTVRGTFVNEGPGEAENVVVTLEPPGRNVEVLEPELALGDLAAGESVDVAFDVEVSSSGRAGDRQFTLSTEYESAGGDDRTADPVRFREPVDPSRDVFAVSAADATVTAGETERVVLSVTNNQEQTVTDVSAKLFTSQPLSVDDDEAFVAELEPGETAEIPFRVSASGSAMAKDYPVSIDFQYVDESGETRLTDSYRLPVRVEEASGGLLGLFGLAGTASLALLIPFARFWQR